MNNIDNLFVESFNAFREEILRINKEKLLLDDVNFYQKAIELAYKDAEFRTVKGHNSANKEEVINKIACVFEKYINSDSDKDNITLIEEVEKILQNDLEGVGKKQSFGKAQKIVNMGFKYFYCLDQSRNNHKYDNNKRDIPLDKNILDFYYSYRKKLKIENDKIISSWSKITKEDYIEVQDNLKKYIKNLISKKHIKDLKFEMSPIKAEFIIWNYAMANSVISTYESAKNNYYKLKKSNNPSDKCYKEIKKLLKKIR